jgi:hypothetical protein
LRAKETPFEVPFTAGDDAEPQPLPALTSRGSGTFIWPSPKREIRFLGYIRPGQSVALQSLEITQGGGCAGGFYAIAPRGYVCRDRTVTLAPEGRLMNAVRATLPAPGPFPYRYALSSGTPMYNRMPTPQEQRRFERKFGPPTRWQPLSPRASAHEDLAVSERIAATDSIPDFIADSRPINPSRLGLVRQEMPLGAMLSYTASFDAGGRTFLLSTDLTLVPADRVRPFRPSRFRGARLAHDVTLPLTFFRTNPRPQYRKLPSGRVERTGGAWPVRSFVGLTGRSFEVDGTRYLETSAQDGAGVLVTAEKDATVVEAERALPPGIRSDQKWVLVRITRGTLVAYEGTRPVYATLISPGRGGVPVQGDDPVRASTTPIGTFYITFKDRAATMSPETGMNRTFWIADVPHTQYFNAPFALHAAYWHERFGDPTSGGCVNLSPLDAEALFDWSDPPVPPGWQGVTGAAAPENGPTTVVVVRR